MISLFIIVFVWGHSDSLILSELQKNNPSERRTLHLVSLMIDPWPRSQTVGNIELTLAWYLAFVKIINVMQRHLINSSIIRMFPWHSIACVCTEESCSPIHSFILWNHVFQPGDPVNIRFWAIAAPLSLTLTEQYTNIKSECHCGIIDSTANKLKGHAIYYQHFK